MNIRYIHILLRTLAPMLLCGLAASCSQDELGIGLGETLPPGKYPLMFTAKIDGMTSRTADGSDAWVDGDTIAAQIGCNADGDYPAVGQYILNADGSVKESEYPLSWPYTEGYVKAWYPYVGYNSTLTKDITNQSAGYHNIDFLYAETGKDEEKRYNETIDLTFRHLMAKVSCKLVKGEGVTDEDMATAQVSFYGYREVSFGGGILSGTGENAWITPDTDNTALVCPQDMSGKPLIKINLTVTVNGVKIPKELTYTPTEANLEAGKHYSYTVTVRKDRLVVESLSASWKDVGEPHPAIGALFKVNLSNRPSGVVLKFSENVDDQGGYLDVRGNHFSISYKITDNTMMKAFVISDGGEKDRMVRGFEDGNYVCNFYILTEKVTLTYLDYVEVGDYYYADGSWCNPNIDVGEAPIGVVFKTGAGGTDDFLDKPENYGWKDKEIHGYVVALKDATPDAVIWGDKVSVPDVPEYLNLPKTNSYSYTGFTYTKSIEDWGKGGKNYTAAKAAIEYKPAPDEKAKAADGISPLFSS